MPNVHPIRQPMTTIDQILAVLPMTPRWNAAELARLTGFLAERLSSEVDSGEWEHASGCTAVDAFRDAATAAKALVEAADAEAHYQRQFDLMAGA